MEKKTMYMIGGGVAVAGIAAYFLMRPKAVAAPVQKLAAGAAPPAPKAPLVFNPAVSRRFIGMIAQRQTAASPPPEGPANHGAGFNVGVSASGSDGGIVQQGEDLYNKGKGLYDTGKGLYNTGKGLYDAGKGLFGGGSDGGGDNSGAMGDIGGGYGDNSGAMGDIGGGYGDTGAMGDIGGGYGDTGAMGDIGGGYGDTGAMGDIGGSIDSEGLT